MLISALDQNFLEMCIYNLISKFLMFCTQLYSRAVPKGISGKKTTLP